jgi:hypothetical protein
MYRIPDIIKVINEHPVKIQGSSVSNPIDLLIPFLNVLEINGRHI